MGSIVEHGRKGTRAPVHGGSVPSILMHDSTFLSGCSLRVISVQYTDVMPRGNKPRRYGRSRRDQFSSTPFDRGYALASRRFSCAASGDAPSCPTGRIAIEVKK